MDTKRQKVLVLLCTYNGEKFLNQQLESIYCQKDVEVKVIVNDDGSTDQTLDILEFWKKQSLILKTFHSNRIGSTEVFLWLLKISSAMEFDFFAFSDQDDVWHEDKLSQQILEMGKSEALMVTSPRDLINSEGHLIGRTQSLHKDLTWRNALVENSAPGNTQLMSKAGIMYLKDAPAGIKYYDAWTYLVLSTFGSVSLVPTPLIDYRLHEENQLGTLRQKNYYEKLFTLCFFVEQAEQFLSFYRENLPEDVTRSVETLTGRYPFRFRNGVIPEKIAYRQSVPDNILISFYLLLPPKLKKWIYFRFRSERKYIPYCEEP